MRTGTLSAALSGAVRKVTPMGLFAELKRRNVFRVAVAYVVATWLLFQVADVLVGILTLPAWTGRLVFLLLLVGFPIALIFAWAYELTPEGLKKESEVDRSESITRQTGRRLDFLIIGILSLALAWFAWDKFVRAPASSAGGGEVMAAASGVAGKRSVAVLPFVAMSSGPDDEYFADGLTEEILNALAQLPELLVTARTSAFSFKGQDLPIQDIAAALGVEHVVEGSVRRSGDRLRITAQLIRADDGFHLWSENFDSRAADAIEVQETIAEDIALALDVVLDDRRREQMRTAGLRDVEAFTLFQKGVDYFERAHGQIEQIAGLRQANEYFDRVIERVPDFPPAYLLRTDYYSHILLDAAHGFRRDGIGDEEIAEAFAAVAADYEIASRIARDEADRDRIALDHAFFAGNWRGMPARIERSLANDPCNRRSNWLSSVADVFGYAAEYAKHALETTRCNPRSSLDWFAAARATLIGGDKEEALRIARQGMEVAPGGWLVLPYVRALLANGLHDEARQVIATQVQDPETQVVLKVMLAAEQGDLSGVDALIAEYRTIDGADPFWLAIFDAWAGRRSEANAFAARVDNALPGYVVLAQIVHWCQCGAPFDPEAAPKFNELRQQGNMPWPPDATIDFPLKDW